MTRAAKNSLALLFFLAAALAPLAPPLAGQAEQTPFPRPVATIETGEDMPVVAAWSPDSERLAYGTEILVERKRSPMAYGDEKFRRYYPGEVWLVTLAEMEKKPKRILRYRFLRRAFGDFSYTVNAVSWSPDGSKLALELTNENKESAVFFFTTKGKRIKLSRRSNFTFGYGGAWLADNESYAMLHESVKPRLLHQVGVLRSVAGRTMALFRYRSFAAVAWLAKKQQVVAAERDRDFADPPQLILGDLKTGKAEVLAEVADYLGGLQAAPDENRVSYFVGQDTLAVRELTPDAEVATFPVPLGRYQWAPTSDAIFFLQPEKLGGRTGRLLRLHLGDPEPRKVLDDVLHNFWLAPDGRHLAVLTAGLEPKLKIYRLK